MMGRMADEIERKFLMATVPDAPVLQPGVQLRQGYLAMDGAVEVRVRRMADADRLTVKAGAGLTRTEVELPLDPADAEALWVHTAGRRVEKLATASIWTADWSPRSTDTKVRSAACRR